MRTPRELIGRAAIVAAGILLGQLLLYGPALVGSKLLLPLDLLALPDTYLPQTPETAKIVPRDVTVLDLVTSVEPARRFGAEELRAGRLPAWTPFQFGGSPFVFPAWSPFWLLSAITPSPRILAWVQVALALVAGTGTYLFCRRVLAVGFLPAALSAWTFPLTGVFIFWAGFPMFASVAWLPWILLAVHVVFERESALAAAALAGATFLVLVSGALDIAGQVLLVSGLYAIGRAIERRRQLPWRPIAVATAGWALGFLLAAPYLLPLLEYTQSGSRMARRGAGTEERPPVGLAALPEVVLPDVYGTNLAGSLPMFPAGQGNQRESASVAYAGLVVTLLVAPLAWCSRRHLSANLFWTVLAVVALGWVLDLPGLVQLLRLPGLNLMSHNRLVFAASFAIIGLAAVGWDVLGRGDVPRRAWFWIPAGLLLGLHAWCAYRAAVPPAAITAAGRGLAAARSGYVRDVLAAGALCGVGAALWLGLWFRPAVPRGLAVAIGTAVFADLLWFASGRAPLAEAALYYPRIPALERIARADGARFVGANNLPPTLGVLLRLDDVRGYDGVDPVRWIDLLKIAADPESKAFSYALTQNYLPRVAPEPPASARLHPVLDLLGVRAVVYRGAPPQGMRPANAGDDYYVLDNPRALGRAFVPERVETVAEESDRLRRMSGDDFDPRAVAYVEAPVRAAGPCRGTATVVEASPARVVVRAAMEADGIVVLADRWDPGWRARVDGREAPILRVDHALRGVELRAGTSTVEFRYAPARRRWGLGAALTALVAMAGWVWVDRTGKRA